MKFSLKVLFFLLFVFFLNILFYFVSSDYRSFIENLKHPAESLEEISDIELQEDSSLQWAQIIDFEDPNIWISLLEEWEYSENEKDVDIVPIQTKVVLWKNYKDIVDQFTAAYPLKKIEVNSSLFELTTEYPDYYYEYYSRDVTLYLFYTRTYGELFDIFDYLSGNLPFTLNEVNNFWDNSFFINLREDISDNFVRLVIWDNGVTFWLKIKKDQYNRVKDILLSFE